MISLKSILTGLQIIGGKRAKARRTNASAQDPSSADDAEQPTDSSTLNGPASRGTRRAARRASRRERRGR